MNINEKPTLILISFSMIGISIIWLFAANITPIPDKDVQEFFKQSSIDEWSCEMLQTQEEFITKHTRDEISLQEIKRLWNEAECDRSDSIYWRGMEWRPEGSIPYWQTWVPEIFWKR